MSGASPKRFKAALLRRWLGPGLLAALACPAIAHAQSAGYFDRNNNVSVLNRPRPEWQALGVNVGTFSVFPSLTIAPEYDDNIFASSSDKQGDLVTVVNPAVLVESNWARNQVQFNAQSTSDIYASHSDQGTTDYQFAGSGRLDVLSASSISAGGGYSHSTIPRTAEDNITSATTPIQFSQISANVSAVEPLSRFKFSEQFQFGRTTYEDSTFPDGAPFILSQANNDQFYFTGRADYALTPAFALFVSAIYNDKPYDFKPPTVPLDRSSTGYETTVGADFDITRLIRGNVQFGYLSQDYNSTAFRTVTGPAVHVNVEYFLSGLTTVTFNADRTVIDAVDPEAISYVQTAGSVRVDHELLRNVILSGRVGYETDDFKGYERNDDRFTGSLSGTYLINRHLGLTAGYSYLNEDSSGAARIGSYSVNVISLSLALRL